MRALGNIEGKLDSVVNRADDHEDRLRTVENTQAIEKGKSVMTSRINGLVAGAIPVAIKVGWDWLTKNPR